MPDTIAQRFTTALVCGMEFPLDTPHRTPPIVDASVTS
jgi:hypothetical protein